MKRLLLLTAVLSASASYVLAQDSNIKTVDDANGNTYTYNVVDDRDPSSYDGQTVSPATASINPNGPYYTLTINSDGATKISDCALIYNVKLSSLADDPGEIKSFSKRLESTTRIWDIGITETQFVSTILEEDIDGNKEPVAYSIKDTKEAQDVYARYVEACERAIEISPAYVVRGNSVPGLYDSEGMELNSSLYYMVSGKKVKTYLPILNVNGTYTDGITYSNCFVTYNPVGIADGYKSYSVSGDGKVGYVSGVVDNGKVEDILTDTQYKKYVNFDFTNASIIGSVNTNVINDNRLAYFNENTDVTGQNFVVGDNCKKYYIYDNGKEIFVKDRFSANDARYYRTFTPETYGSIVLPFSVSATSNIFVKQAKLTDYVASENRLVFTSTEKIAPNTPYMFKVLATVTGESTLRGDVGGTVEATAEAKSEKIQGAQFAGTFEGLSAAIASQVYVIGAVGKIGRTTKELKPGRCYLTREDPDNFAKMESATIEIIDEDGAIEKVEADEAVTAIDGVVNGEVVSVQYISVNGQISNEPFSGVNLVKKTFEDGSVETSKVVY